MWYLLRHKKTLTTRLAMFAALFALIISLASYNKSENATAENKAVQRMFATAADAGAAFLDAAKSDLATTMAEYNPGDGWSPAI